VDDAERRALDTAVDNGVIPIAHGVRHLMIDGVWCAATERCNVADHDGLPDDVEGRFQQGRHPVDFDFGDGTEIAIFAINEDEAAIR
jgi:hypothetical protein